MSAIEAGSSRDEQPITRRRAHEGAIVNCITRSGRVDVSTGKGADVGDTWLCDSDVHTTRGRLRRPLYPSTRLPHTSASSTFPLLRLLVHIVRILLMILERAQGGRCKITQLFWHLLVLRCRFEQRDGFVVALGHLLSILAVEGLALKRGEFLLRRLVLGIERLRHRDILLLGDLRELLARRRVILDHAFRKQTSLLVLRVLAGELGQLDLRFVEHGRLRYERFRSELFHAGSL